MHVYNLLIVLLFSNGVKQKQFFFLIFLIIGICFYCFWINEIIYTWKKMVTLFQGLLTSCLLACILLQY